MRIPFLSRLLEIKELQVDIEKVKIGLLTEIRNALLTLEQEVKK